MILASDRRGWRKVLFLAQSEAPEPVTLDCIQSKSLCFSSLPPLSLLSQKPSRQRVLSHTLTCIPIKEFLQEPCPQRPSTELVACSFVSWKLRLLSATLCIHETYLLWRRVSFLCSFYTPDAPGLGDCQTSCDSPSRLHHKLFSPGVSGGPASSLPGRLGGLFCPCLLWSATWTFSLVDSVLSLACLAFPSGNILVFFFTTQILSHSAVLSFS